MILPKLTWVSSPNWSNRNASIDQIILHDCEGSFGGSVNWFTQKLSKVSAHYVISENGLEAAQMVATDKAAWHAMAPYNHRSIGVELAGWAKRGFPEAEWTAAANVCAFLLHHHNIPAKWAKGGDGPGLLRHYDLLGKANNTHFDPVTDDSVWTKFVARVQSIVAAGGFPDSWEPDHTGNAKTFAIPHSSAQTTVHPVGR